MKIKKLTSVILAAMMTATAVPFNEVTVPYNNFASYAVEAESEESYEQEIVAEGTCGENLTWTIYDDEKVLVISGEGAMTNWESSDATPWAEYNDYIEAVRIDEGVTEIGENSFDALPEDCLFFFYNYDCIIPDSNTALPQKVNISCYKNSTAEEYAIKYGKEFSLVMGPGLSSIADGECGKNLYWIIYDNMIIRIVGEGEMDSWESPEDTPWNDYANDFTTAIIEEDVTKISENTFASLDNLKAVVFNEYRCEIPDSAAAIPENVIIYGYAGSTAEEYAINYGRQFINMGGNYFEQQPITTGGECGENVSWNTDGLGTIYFEGNGKMDEWESPDDTPWNFMSDSIKHAVFSEEVTNISENILSNSFELDVIIRNPECEIADNPDLFGYSFAVITGYEGSTAQAYAEKYNKEFVTLTDNDDSDSPEIDGPIVIASGICGENLTWEAYNEGSLMIFGEGSMADYTTPEDVPWAEYASEVFYVEISETVDYIGENAFVSCENANTISIKNPECVFAESPDIFHANSVICGYPGSTTADYAEKYNMDYTDFSLTIAEGTCGENLVWEIYDPGSLSIYGEGEMYDYANPEDAPWVEYVNDIFSVFVSSANISENALVSCKNASVVCISDPYCVIPDSPNVFPENAVICGDAGSTAEKYALKYGREFEAWTDNDDLEQGVIASGKLGENIEWVLTDNGAIYFDGEGDMPDFDGVTPWSEYTSLIRTVSMSEKITSIGDYAFYGCENLVTGAFTSVIGAHAYEGCKRMNGYSHYGDVSPINEIRDCAFKGCYSLWAIPIANPDCIIADSEDVFDNNTAIEGYVGSTAHKYAEKYERDFQDITLIDSEGSCGESLYWYMTSDGMLGIGGSGEMDNYSEDITAAPWYSFAEKITSICINDFNTDDDAIALSENCFAMCENVEKIYFHNSVCIIADSAETIPENAVIMGYEGSTAQEYAEKYNREFEAIPTTDATGTLNEEFTWELNSEGILYITGFDAMDDYTDDNPWGEYADKITSVYFYGNVTSIGKNAFSYCENLEFVDIDESIEFIDMDAFSGCDKLEYLNFHGNKKCVIYDNASTIPAQTELIGHFGSPVHEYADKYERSFYWIDGDINVDNSVDAGDASMVLAEYANIQTGGEAELSSVETTTADVTNDNVVDAADASAILQYYAKVLTGQKPTWD